MVICQVLEGLKQSVREPNLADFMSFAVPAVSDTVLHGTLHIMAVLGISGT